MRPYVGHGNVPYKVSQCGNNSQCGETLHCVEAVQAPVLATEADRTGHWIQVERQTNGSHVCRTYHHSFIWNTDMFRCLQFQLSLLAFCTARCHLFAAMTSILDSEAN